MSAEDPEDSWIQGCKITVHDDEDGDHTFRESDEILRVYSASLEVPTSAIVFGPSSMSREARRPRVMASVLTLKGEAVHDRALAGVDGRESGGQSGG